MLCYDTVQGSEAGEVTSGTVSYEPELLQQDREELMVWEERPGPPEKTASQIMWYNIAYEKVGYCFDFKW